MKRGGAAEDEIERPEIGGWMVLARQTLLARA